MNDDVWLAAKGQSKPIAEGISGKYNKRNPRDEQSNTNNKLYQTYSLCIFLILSTLFKVRLKTVDEIIFLPKIMNTNKSKLIIRENTLIKVKYFSTYNFFFLKLIF